MNKPISGSFDLSKSAPAAPQVPAAPAAPAEVAPTFVAGSDLKIGQFVRLAGVAIFEVNKCPQLIPRKDKEDIELCGGASLVSGSCTQRSIDLWPARNYEVVTFVKAGAAKLQPAMQKGPTSTNNMTTARPEDRQAEQAGE